MSGLRPPKPNANRMWLAWLRKDWPLLLGFGYIAVTSVLAGALLIEGPIDSQTLGFTALAKFLFVWLLLGFPIGISLRRWSDRQPDWELKL